MTRTVLPTLDHFHSKVLALKTGSYSRRHRGLVLVISCATADWQLSALAQIFASSLPVIPTLEHLKIYDPFASGKEEIEHSQWLELLYPFTTVKSLYLHTEVGLRVATALQELAGESVAHVLPGIFIKGVYPSGPTPKTQSAGN